MPPAGPLRSSAILEFCLQAVGEVEFSLGGARDASRARERLSLELARLIEEWLQPLDPGTRLPGLTAREADVARLVAAGLTNAQIAASLHTSRTTVSTHVAHILAKLDYRSRAQIAAWVAGL